MIKWLALFIGVAHAQVSASFLTFPNQAACLARSQAQCQALGCDGVHTVYWWACQPLTNGQSVVIVQPSGPFAAVQPNRGVGLNAAEQSNLATTTQLATALPWVLSIVTFRARFTPAQITAITGSTDTVVTSGWNAINGAATVNLQAPSVVATVSQMVVDGIITPENALIIMAQTATP